MVLHSCVCAQQQNRALFNAAASSKLKRFALRAPRSAGERGERRQTWQELGLLLGEVTAHGEGVDVGKV